VALALSLQIIVDAAEAVVQSLRHGLVMAGDGQKGKEKTARRQVIEGRGKRGWVRWWVGGRERIGRGSGRQLQDEANVAPTHGATL